MAGAAQDDERAHVFGSIRHGRRLYLGETGPHTIPFGPGEPRKESFTKMATFDERKKGFEAKFKRDEELRFKATARRNKLLGLWAAEKMGLEDAEAYAREVVKSDFERPGDDDVLEKVLADLQAKGVDASEESVRMHMIALLAVAVDQIGRASCMERVCPYR